MKYMMLALLCALVAGAGPLTAAEQQPTGMSAYDSVKASTNELLDRLVEVQPVYEEDPDRFFSEVQDALNPYIDFAGFAKGVMAKHYRNASDDQRQAFESKFRDGLVRTYATALLEFDNQEVVVLEPTTPQKRDDRATIDLEIHTKSGSVYPIQYQLVLEDGRWLLRNVIINGINIGLQFRSQFNAYMQQYSQDIDKVVENWSVDVQDQA